VSALTGAGVKLERRDLVVVEELAAWKRRPASTVTRTVASWLERAAAPAPSEADWYLPGCQAGTYDEGYRAGFADGRPPDE
jgi:hypothetical protein